ncbi:hypothetical protein M885DRAFT_617851 [Pelagophyceae sp. CCMP2097]|nr:hypothetical protein M885DRAFT_617851 [Pelagophyceae sp. CCMP2097]
MAKLEPSPVATDDGGADRTAARSRIGALEEELKSLRAANRLLETELRETTETMSANVEDRDRVIAMKGQIIQDLVHQRAEIERGIATTKERHHALFASSATEYTAKRLSMEREGEEVELQLEKFGKLQLQRTALTDELYAARADFDAVVAEQAQAMAAFEDKIKAEELGWVQELARSAEASAKKQKEIVDNVTLKFDTMQREHREMQRRMRHQALAIGRLLDENKAKLEAKTLKRVEYDSLVEENALSHKKLGRLAHAAEQASFLGFGDSTLATIDGSTFGAHFALHASVDGSLAASRQPSPPRPSPVLESPASQRASTPAARASSPARDYSASATPTAPRLPQPPRRAASQFVIKTGRQLVDPRDAEDAPPGFEQLDVWLGEALEKSAAASKSLDVFLASAPYPRNPRSE